MIYFFYLARTASIYIGLIKSYISRKMSATSLPPIPSLPKPGEKKSKFETMKDLCVKYKKSCAACIGVVILIIILLIVWAHHQPTGFVSKYVPTWNSPDMKLL